MLTTFHVGNQQPYLCKMTKGIEIFLNTYKSWMLKTKFGNCIQTLSANDPSTIWTFVWNLICPNSSGPTIQNGSYDLQNLRSGFNLSTSPFAVLVERILNGDQRVFVAQICVKIGQVLAGHLQVGCLPRVRAWGHEGRPKKNWQLVWVHMSMFLEEVYIFKTGNKRERERQSDRVTEIKRHVRHRDTEKERERERNKKRKWDK